MKPASPKPSKRDEILAAAERRLRDGGPASLRLTELAEEAGVSHPAVLHHFGSREGLVRAVVERAMTRLTEDLLAAFRFPGDDPDGAALLDRVATTLGKRGHARLLTWLLLEGSEPLHAPELLAGFRAVVDATHALRPDGASHDDTAFTVILSFLALYAAAVLGRDIFRGGGLPATAATERRFRGWLAALLADRLARP